MRAFPVVFVEPRRHEDARFPQGQEQPPIETAIAQHGMKALHMPVLPRLAWIDIAGLHGDLAQPVLDRCRDELGPIVALQTAGGPPLSEEPLEDPEDIARGDRPVTLNCEPLAGKCIQHRDELQPLAVRRLIVHEIVTSDVVGGVGCGDRRRRGPHMAPFLLLLHHA